MRYRFLWVGWVLLVLVGCSGVTDKPISTDVLRDDGGAYTVSVRKRVTLGPSGEALGVQSISTPALTLELRNYNAQSTGPRSRGVAAFSWPVTDAAFEGSVRLGLETIEGKLVASYGVVDAGEVVRRTTLTTPYVYQPGRFCVFIEANLQASEPSGDQLSFELKQRVCEGDAWAIQQDILLASQTADKAGIQTTTELRYLDGLGYRALVRYKALESASATGKLCLYEEGKASCKRSASTAATFAGGGVAEFITGYYDAPEDALLCAGISGVSTCRSGGVELLKHHSYNGGVNTNVVLLKTAEGVVARAIFSVPEGVSLLAYAYLDTVHGGDYESFFSLYGRQSTTRGVPSMTGPTKQTLELGPLLPGAEKVCYSLGVPYVRSGEYPELIELNGCAEGELD